MTKTLVDAVALLDASQPEKAIAVTTAQFLAGYMAKLVGKQLEAAQRRADKRKMKPRYVALKRDHLTRHDGKPVMKHVIRDGEFGKETVKEAVYGIHVVTLNWSRNKTIQINGRQYADGPGKREQERVKRQRIAAGGYELSPAGYPVAADDDDYHTPYERGMAA